jgi:hypothetical protein
MKKQRKIYMKKLGKISLHKYKAQNKDFCNNEHKSLKTEHIFWKGYRAEEDQKTRSGH